MQVGDCLVNVDNSIDSSSSLGSCGGWGVDDGYCEVKGDKVRACFLDRCWQESQTQCGDWSTSSSSISLWMQVTCEIADHVIPRKALHVVPLCRFCPLTPDHRRRIQLGGLPDLRPHRHHTNVSAAALFASSFKKLKESGCTETVTTP